MTKLYHKTLTDIVIRIDDIRRALCVDDISDGNRDKLLSDLEKEHENLYQTIKELLFLDRPEDVDIYMVESGKRNDLLPL